MKEEKRKFKFQKLLTSILAISLILTLFEGVLSYADGGNSPSGEDITGHFNITLNSLSYQKGSVVYDLIKDGAIQPAPSESLKVGDILEIGYSWGITQDKAKHVKKDNYFLIKLPNQNFLKHYGATEQDLSISDNTNTPIKFGTTKVVTLSDGTKAIKVVFDIPEIFNGETIRDSEGRLTRALTDGRIEASLEAKAVSENVDIHQAEYGLSALKIKIENKPNTGGGGGSGTQPFTPSEDPGMGGQDPIYKFGHYKKDKNWIHYNFAINRDQVKKIYDFNGTPTDSNYLNFPLKQTIDNKHIVVIDELPEGLELDADSLEFSVPFYMPGLDSSQHVIKNPTDKEPLPTFIRLNFTKTSYDFRGKIYFNLIESTEATETWEAFKTRVKASQTPTIGIWNKTKFIIDFKQMPDADKKYSDLYTNLEDEIDKLKGKKVTAEQALYMKAAFSGDRPIVNFNVYFNAKIKGPIKSEYHNTVSYENNGGENQSKTKSIFIPRLSNSFKLGPEGGKINVEKTWVGTPKWPVKVSLLDDGGEIVQTIELTAGNSKGTFSGLRNDKQYEVREHSVEGYDSVITTKSDKTVLITNKEKTPVIPKTSIEAKKVWKNHLDVVEGSAGKPDITFKLMKKTESVDAAFIDVTGLEATKVLTGGTSSVTFADLPTEDGSGNKIEYKVVETTVLDGYETANEGIEGNSYTITNKKKAPKIPFIPSPDPSPTPTPPSPTPEPSPSPDQSPTPTPEPSPSPDPSPTPTPTPTPPSPDPLPPIIIPPSPTLIPFEEEPTIEIPIIDDEIPEGNIEIPQKPKTPDIVKVENPEDDLLIEEEDTPLGNTKVEKEKKKNPKRVLAKTGGMEVLLVRSLMILFVLFSLFVLLEAVERKFDR